SGWDAGGLYGRGPEVGWPGVVRPAGPLVCLRAGPRVGWLGGPPGFAGRREVEPDRGAGRVPEVAPLGGEVLDEEQPVPRGRGKVALHDRSARGTVVDDLDEDAARYADDDDGDGSALDTRFGALDGVSY